MVDDMEAWLGGPYYEYYLWGHRLLLSACDMILLILLYAIISYHTSNNTVCMPYCTDTEMHRSTHFYSRIRLERNILSSSGLLCQEGKRVGTNGQYNIILRYHST